MTDRHHRTWRGRSYRPYVSEDTASIYHRAIEEFIRENGVRKYSFRRLVDLSFARLFADHSDEFRTLYKAQILRDRPTFNFLKQETPHERTSSRKALSRQSEARKA